jgi:hypothetical protein
MRRRYAPVRSARSRPQYGQVAGDVSGRACEECSEAGRVGELVERAQDLGACDPDQARECATQAPRPIGVVAARPPRAAAPSPRAARGRELAASARRHARSRNEFDAVDRGLRAAVRPAHGCAPPPAWLHRLVLLSPVRLRRLLRSVARTPRARPLGCGSIEWRRAEAALSRWIARARDSVGDHRREDSPPRFLASGEERPDALLSCGPAVSAFEVAAGDRVSLTLSWFPAHALRAATADRVAAVRETVAVLARLVGAVDLRRAVPHPDRDPPRSAVASLVISA